MDTERFARLLQQYVDSQVDLHNEKEMATAHVALIEASIVLGVPWPTVTV